MESDKTPFLKNIKNLKPDNIYTYFLLEWPSLLLVTVTGLIYNLGLLAGPYFEGKMAGVLTDIYLRKDHFDSMLILAIWYIISIILVQSARYFKRFYVRRFANNVNRKMKKILYESLIGESKAKLEDDGVGNIITKAISDVDDCVEGMRKFTTEVFDTGVALLAYGGMLLFYDYRLALICLIFPAISYFIAQQMKYIVQKTGAIYKQKSGALTLETLDIINNTLTYRNCGLEDNREDGYDNSLSQYEEAAVNANIWNVALPPIYNVISMISVIFIIYFGKKNVLHTGFADWDIAAFTTFIACYTKLSVKSFKAAKLFNSVQKAQVSWGRIKPYMKESKGSALLKKADIKDLELTNVTFSYPGVSPILKQINLTANKGEIIGVTGQVASGKSSLGRLFLCEYPYEGSIKYGGEEIRVMEEEKRRGIFAYLGHDPELFSVSIKENILFDREGDATELLKKVCLMEEVSKMENGVDTLLGNAGVKLSGGQMQRLALARTLNLNRPVIILDDPFSALDRKTEEEIFQNLKELAKNSILIIISHRLYLFPQFSKVIWLDNKLAHVATHEELLETEPMYKKLYLEEER